MGIYKVITEEVKRLFSDSFYAEQELHEIGEGGETYPWELTHSVRNEAYVYQFDTEEDQYAVMIADDPDEPGDWIIDFKTRDTGFADTNRGRVFKVMATVMAIINDFINGYEQPNFMKFVPSDSRRRNLYVAYMKKNLPPRFKVHENGVEILIMPKEEWDYEDNPYYQQYGDKDVIAEVGEGGHQPYPWRQTRQDKHNYDYEFQTEDGDDYEVVVMDVGNFWNVDFKTKTGHFEDVVNKGRFFNVMATVGAAVKDFLIKEQPEMIRISPAKNSNADQRRLNIYMQLLQKQLPPNYEASTSGGYIYVQKAEQLDMVAEDIDRHSSNLLYHVTGIKNLEDVKKYGLLPQFGETVKQAYADYYKIDDREDDPEDYDNQRQELEFDGLLFFSEKPMLQYAHAGLGQYDLKWNEVLLCVVEKNDTIFHKVDDYPRFTDYRGEEVDSIEYMSVYDLPIMIETGDWFSFEEQGVEDLLYGERLREFMQNNFEQEAQRLVAEEMEKLLAEGTGDRYAEKAFGIKDSNQDYMQQTHRAIHDPDMGELIGYAHRYLGGGKRSPIKDYPIYKNPKNLSKFDAGVRALSDSDGNLYVGLNNGDYLHGAMQQQGMAYELDWGLTWQRVGDTNKFGLSDSSAGYPYVPNENKRQKFSKHLDAVQRVNPQFEFYKEYYHDLMEGVGDRYAEKQWGIPDQDKKYQDMGVPDANMGERIADVWGHSWKDNKNINYGPIYKNPKSLRGFDADVRAIAFKNGDLYVAQQDGDFIHTDMESSLSKKMGIEYDYIELHRAGDSNTFGISDTLQHTMEEYEVDPYPYYQALEKRFPQYRFSLEYYQELREVEDNSDHRPDEMPYFVGEVVGEEVQALVEGYSSYEEKQNWEKDYQEHLKARSQDNANGVLVKRLVDDNQEVINIYQNPKSLRNFGKGVRAISIADGNLFVAQFDKEFLHADMAEGLGIPRDDYIAWHRMMETNNFNSVDTGVHGDAQEYIQAVQQLNPGFEFHVMDISQYQP